MKEDLDPAQLQEGVSDDASTVTDPQVTEEVAESEEKSEEGAGAPQEDQQEQVEIVVEGHEPEPQKDAAPPWVKDLRKKYRESEERAAELERKLSAYQQPSQAEDPGPKPTLEGCEFDPVAFEAKLESWHDARKRKEAMDAQRAQAADAGQRAWQSRLDAYGKSKADLARQVPDYADAEAAVRGRLDITQQGVLIHCSDNAALVICALGQNPKLLEDLAKETDAIRFAVKVAKLEDRVKTQKKTQVPPPEKRITGSGSSSATADSQLEKLEAEAARTGDRTKVVAYKRSKRTG